MRITDSRYDRDRRRLEVAYRLIGLEARTQTIHQATTLSADRVRKLYRDYFKNHPDQRVKRHRGKSPRQMSFFWRSPTHELHAAALAALMMLGGFLERPQVLYRPDIEEVDRFCDVYETFHGLCPATPITFEHAWHLLHVLARIDEYVLVRCPDCRSTWIRDTLDLLPDNCAACRVEPPD